MAAPIKIASEFLGRFRCKYISLARRCSSQSVQASNTSQAVPESVTEHTPDDLYRRILVEVKGHDKSVLNSYEHFIRMMSTELDLNLNSVETPPEVRERYTQLKSASVHKKHRVQYESRTHFRTFEFKKMTGSTATTVLEYIQRNLPEGVAMKVTKHKLAELPDALLSPPER